MSFECLSNRLLATLRRNHHMSKMLDEKVDAVGFEFLTDEGMRNTHLLGNVNQCSSDFGELHAMIMSDRVKNMSFDDVGERQEHRSLLSWWNDSREAPGTGLARVVSTNYPGSQC